MVPNLISRHAFLSAACLTFVAAQLWAADDWPEFRGPTGQGISSATNVPVSWSATNNIIWKTAIPGEGWSSPVVVKGRIYLTTAIVTSNADEPSLRALCVDARDGQILWNVEAMKPAQGAARKRHPKNGNASPTPIVRADRLYLHFGHMGTAALGLDGKILWRQTELKYPPTHGNGGSPALVEERLIFSCDGEKDPFVAALDARTGAPLWKTARNTSAAKLFSFSTPLAIEVDGATQVISAGSGFVGGYNPKDGSEIWRVRYGEGYSVITRPVFSNGLLFVSSGYDRPVLYAIKPAEARGDVTASHVAWTHLKGVPNTPSPVLAGDELYFVSDAGIATCLDARSGNVHWSERLGGGFSASPVVAEGRIYFLNEEGVGYVVKTGKAFELLATNVLGDRTLASPAVLNNALIIRSKTHLWRIGRKE